MIVQCEKCLKYFEDEYRSYVCPHIAFPANDGFNNFKARTDSYLSDTPPAPKDVQVTKKNSAVQNQSKRESF